MLLEAPQRLVVKVRLGRCWVAGLGCMQLDVWRSFGLASTVRAARTPHVHKVMWAG